jgi:hypothetical protein
MSDVAAEVPRLKKVPVPNQSRCHMLHGSVDLDCLDPAWHTRVAFRTAHVSSRRVVSLIAIAPLFLIFEVWQLVLSERYLGIKQIARGADPRNLGLREITAFFWSLLLIAYWIWMLVLLFIPFARTPAAALLLVSMLGFSLRRGARFKWILVILTLEGAIRIGLLLYLAFVAWRWVR